MDGSPTNVVLLAEEAQINHVQFFFFFIYIYTKLHGTSRKAARDPGAEHSAASTTTINTIIKPAVAASAVLTKKSSRVCAVRAGAEK